MEERIIQYNTEAREKIKTGVDKLANAVKVTLGPKGRNVAYKAEDGTIKITKDGVTVAKHVFLNDPMESIGAEVVKETSALTNKLVGDAPQDLDSAILTPTGWATMRDMKVGSVICGTNGTFQKVTGVYPQGEHEVYNVHLSGGAVVKCSYDHLWTVRNRRGTKKTLQLKELIKDYIKISKRDGSKSSKYFVETTTVDFIEDKQKLPIDPYFLGLLLGDGSLSGGTKRTKATIELALGKNKEHVLDKIVLPKGVNMRSTWVASKNYFRVKFTGVDKNNNSIMKKLLNDIELLGVKSKSKFIPDSYLYSSIKTRKALLQGLLDTDGHINKRGLFEFTTSSKDLANDFSDLCRGLGKQISISEKENKIEAGAYNNSLKYLVIERKGYKYGNKITKIEATGEFKEMQCIRVSNEDHLYLTDYYTLTHNTTTSTVLAQAIFNEGYEVLKTGYNPIRLKEEMEAASELIVSEIKKVSEPIDGRLLEIATISANGDNEIGSLVVEALEQAGPNGITSIKDSGSMKSFVDITKGMQFEKGYLSPYFVTNSGTMECVLERPYVVVTDMAITHASDLTPITSKLSPKQPFLLIAKEVSGEALSYLGMNAMRNMLTVCAIQAPGTGEFRDAYLQDIAILLGTRVQKDDLDPNDVGDCEKVVITNMKTTIFGGVGDVTDRVNQIKEQIASTEDEYETEKLVTRLAKLDGGIAIINIGAHSEVDMLERKDRVEDALNATKAAMREGIVKGGGITLNNISAAFLNSDNSKGAQVLYKAIKVPMETIFANAGGPFEIEDNVFDPAMATRIALENAVSVASTLLTTECVITY